MERCTDNMRVVKSQLSHCLDLFDVMSDAGREHRLTDLATHLGNPKSSVQRLLDHLREEGWVEQNTATGHYRLTLRLALLGHRYMQSAGIADATQGILNRVAQTTNELVRLTVVDQTRLVWIGAAQGAAAGLLYQPSMGGSILAFATANGKAWLATLADEEACAIALGEGLGRTPASGGPKAVRSIDALRAELATARARGYAVADEEAEAGVAAIAVAIRDPQTGIALGTTSVAGPMVRLPSARHPAIAATLASAALELARVWPLPRPSAAHSASLASKVGT